jgi:hypothetical protein
MISPTDLFHPPPAPHFKTFQVFLIYCPNWCDGKENIKKQQQNLPCIALSTINNI